MNQKFLTGIETSGNLTVDSQSAVNETVFDVQGTQGQLFSVTNGLSGDLFSVSDISGVPILNVNSSGSITLDGTVDSSIIMPTAGSQIRIGSFTDGGSNSGEYANDDLVIGDGSISIYPHRRGDYGLNETAATSTTFRSKLNIWSDAEDHITFGGANTHMVTAWEDFKIWINNDSGSAGTLHLYNKTSKTEFAKFSGDGTSSFINGKFLVNGELESTSLDVNGNADISGTLDVTGNATFSNWVHWDLNGAEYAGDPRAVVMGYSGGNYGSIGYNIAYTSTSNSHTRVFGDIPTRMDLNNGILLYSSATGSAGTAISWTELLQCQTSAFQYKDNNIFYNGYTGNATFAGKASFNTTQAPAANIQAGAKTFGGGNGVFADSRLGIMNNGNLTSIVNASTYNDANYPDYGLVFIQGPSTSSYNVWSISPDGPAKGSDLNLLYQAQATNIHTSTPKVKFHSTGGATFAGALKSSDGSASAPAYSFSGRTDTGMYAADHGSNDRIWFTIDGSNRFYIDANGANVVGNLYLNSGNSVRNYSGVWAGTTGTAGNGFYFLNTAGGNTTKAMELSSGGNATFAGDVNVGGFTDSGTSALNLRAGGEHDTKLGLFESNLNHGFSLNYDGGDNKLYLKRHDNSSGGSAVLTFQRYDNNAAFAGDVTVGSNKLTAGSLDINGNADISGITTLHHGGGSHTTTFGSGNEINTKTAAGASATMYLNWASGAVNITKALVVQPGTTGTAAFGGDVTIADDLTVNGTAQLGNALSDKAIIHGHLGIGHEGSPKIAYPGQNALWGEANNSTVGQVVIDLPGTLANYDMTYMEIDIYEYNSTNATKLIIGGHNWNSNGNSGTGNLMWYNAGVTVIGSNPKSVYLGWRNDGTNNRRVIAIGETNSTWNYPTIHVAKVHGNDGYSSSIDWVGDWAMNLTTSSSFFTKSPTTNFNTTAITTFKTRGKISASGAAFTNDVTVGGSLTTTGIVDLGSSSSSIKKTANTSGNHAAIELYSSGTSDTGAAIAIQQQTSEGDTIIFADYEPHVEWGISAENGANEIHFTAGSSTNSLGSKTFKSNAGNDRTAYKKMIVNLSSGNVAVGGTLTSSGKITGTELEGTSLDINGDADVSGALTLGTALAVAEGGTGATNLNALVQTSGNQTITGVKQFSDYINASGNIHMAGHLYNTNDSNSIDLIDHGNYTWFRNNSYSWVFQGGSGGDDWTRSFRFTLEGVGSGFNDKLMIIGQQQNNGTDGGKYKGVRIVKSTGSSSVVDGYLQAGDVVITGNLEVQGTTTTVNQTNLDVQDNIIGLNRSVASNANDSGIIIERGDVGNNAALIWDEGDDHFILGTTTADAASTGSITVTGGNLKLGGLLLDGNTITGVDDSEEFTNDDAHIMTSAAIEDKILGYNYAVVNANTTGSSGSCTGNAATATSATTASSAAKLTDGGGISTDPGTGNLIYTGPLGSSVTGLFAASDNSNSIITVNRHGGNYNSQLGFSSNGNLYYRKFSNSTAYTTQGWKTLAFTDNASMLNSNVTLATLGAQAAGSYAAASHNHDDRYYTETETDARFTSTNGTEHDYTFKIADEGNMSGNRWYHVATTSSGNGGLHIRGFMSNHVESFASQKFDLAIQVREGNDGGQLEITGSLDVLHNNTSGTDRAGIRVIKSAENGNYDEFKVYIRTCRYSMVTLRLTEEGTFSFNTDQSSPLTSEPAPVSGGHVEIDTSTTVEGNYVVDNSTIKEIFHEGHLPTLSELGFTGDSDATNDQDLSGLLPKSGGTMSNGASINFPTSAGNVRGYIQATETNDEHFIIATSGGEDIAFKDGGLSGTTNLISRGDGNLWVRGAIQNGTIDYSQVNGTVPTWNQNTSGSSGSCTGNAATATTATTATTANAVAWGNITSKPYIETSAVTSATTTTTVATISGTTYAAVFFDYVIFKSSNIRAGTVVACSDGTSVSFTETSTTDLGDTSDVTLAVDLSSSNFRLRATTTSSTWNIKALTRAI